jgi:hypothetical protein
MTSKTHAPDSLSLAALASHALPIHSHTHTHPLIHSHTLSLIHSYTHTHSHSSTHTLTHTHTHPLIHSYTHTHSHSSTHTLIHSHTHTHLTACTPREVSCSDPAGGMKLQCPRGVAALANLWSSKRNSWIAGLEYTLSTRPCGRSDSGNHSATLHIAHSATLHITRGENNKSVQNQRHQISKPVKSWRHSTKVRDTLRKFVTLQRN